MLEVTIYSAGGRELKRYELNSRRCLKMGRSNTCDIQVPYDDVSRLHAQLVPGEEDDWTLQDLESTHGCVVGKERKRQIEITPGIEVRMGSAIVKFTSLADRIGAELNEHLEDTDPNAETTEPVADTKADTLPPRPPVLKIELVTAAGGASDRKRTLFFWKS